MGPGGACGESEVMTIGRLAREVGLNVETIRYYQRIGLIAEPAKPKTGYRKYSAEILEQLLFIKRAKQLGFTLKEIKRLLSLQENSDVCSEMCSATERLLEDIRGRIQDLQRMETELSSLLQTCTDSSGCMVLKALQSPNPNGNLDS